jgi:ParB family chromosome partitioning protein
MAFSISDDHARQEQVWQRISSSHMQEPYCIKRLLTETTVRADDRRAVYVGAEAYEAAGIVLRDLFEQDSGGWFQDAALLEQLTFDKLKVDAETIRSEGWKWVEVAISFPYGHASGLCRIYGAPQELGAEEIERYDMLKTEYDKLDAEYAEAEDYDAQVENRLEQLGSEIDVFNDRHYVYDPEQVEGAGVFGRLQRTASSRSSAASFVPRTSRVSRPTALRMRTPNPATMTAAATASSSMETPQTMPLTVMRPMTERSRRFLTALSYELTAQRTLAMRNALAADADVAFVAALHAFVLQVFCRFASDTCLDISVKSSSFPQVQGLGETPWAKEIAERHEAWDRDLPDEEHGLWQFLLNLDEASCRALFAHYVSLSLNAVVEPWNRRPRAVAQADVVAGALGFDMVSAGWTPTVDDYLGKVTKARIFEAFHEARGEEFVQLIDHLNTRDMTARPLASSKDRTGCRNRFAIQAMRYRMSMFLPAPLLMTTVKIPSCPLSWQRKQLETNRLAKPPSRPPARSLTQSPAATPGSFL